MTSRCQSKISFRPPRPYVSRQGDWETFDKVTNVNLRGTILIFAQAAQHAAEGGRIIALSSSVLAKSFPTYGPYIASKAGVEGLVRVLANELRGRNITVNAVAPGPTGTSFETREEAARLDRATFFTLAFRGRIGPALKLKDLQIRPSKALKKHSGALPIRLCGDSFNQMAKKLVIIRNSGSSTYGVHGEQDQPPQRFVGGVSLDIPRLKTELIQHGCPEEVAANALQAVESSGSTTIYL